jgi:hypothetical protein
MEGEAEARRKNIQNEATATNPRDQPLLCEGIPEEAGSDGGVIEGLGSGVGRG